jgi:glutamine---fructose-6-phosphate transaminase (isomerizing)
VISEASQPTTMAAEIAEQPAAIARTIDGLLPLVPEVRALAGDCRHVTFAARGSSDNAAIYGRYLCELHAGVPSGLAAPSVATRYERRMELDDTLVVGISQSGETEEIVETLSWARACGARTLAVTNDRASRLASTADVALSTAAGVERAVPATKTYTTQLAAMAVLGAALGPERDPLLDELAAVPAEVARMLETDGAVGTACAAIARAERVVVSGRAYTLSTAMELSLKLLETCYVPSLGLSYADLLHGPVAVVDDRTTVLIVAPPTGPLLAPITALVRTLRERAATVVGIGGDEAFGAACSVALARTRLSEPLSPLSLVVPGQLTVEALARRLGLDPDAPRGLRKVTQTDVSEERE